MRIVLAALCAILLIMGACNEAPAEETVQEEQTPAFDALAADNILQAIKSTYQKAKEANELTEKFRQEIGLKVFNQEEVDISEIQLAYKDKDIIWINTRFQNIIPMGGKYWYISQGKAHAVEVYKNDTDDEGNVIEIPMYTLLFDPAGENHQFTNVKGELAEDKKAKLIEENLQEWKDVQQWIEKYRPKDEEEK